MKDLTQGVRAFDALCDQAREALDDLEVVAKGYRAQYAEQHGVDPSQVELFVVGDGSAIEPVIRSK